MNDLTTINDIKNRFVVVRGNPSLLDRDIAILYGVETREINQAIRNNPDKFPDGYVVQLSSDEFRNWKSKILISNLSDAEKSAIKMGVRRAPYAFTEKGLYMLATILKGERAVQTTIKIIETYAQVRELKRELVALHTETDKKKRTSLLHHFGDLLTSIVMPDLDATETESSLEINFFIGKLKHTVRRVKRADTKKGRK